VSINSEKNIQTIKKSLGERIIEGHSHSSDSHEAVSFVAREKGQERAKSSLVKALQISL
jgi:hypothetical protein